MTIVVGSAGAGSSGSGAISGGFKIFELMFNQTTGAALPAGTVRPAIFADKTAMQSYFTAHANEFERFKASGRVCEIGTIDSNGNPLTINNEAYSYVEGQVDPYVNVVGGLVGAKGDKGDTGDTGDISNEIIYLDETYNTVAELTKKPKKITDRTNTGNASIFIDIEKSELDKEEDMSVAFTVTNSATTLTYSEVLHDQLSLNHRVQPNSTSLFTYSKSKGSWEVYDTGAIASEVDGGLLDFTDPSWSLIEGDRVFHIRQGTVSGIDPLVNGKIAIAIVNIKSSYTADFRGTTQEVTLISTDPEVNNTKWYRSSRGEIHLATFKQVGSSTGGYDPSDGFYLKDGTNIGITDKNSTEIPVLKYDDSDLLFLGDSRLDSVVETKTDLYVNVNNTGAKKVLLEGDAASGRSDRFIRTDLTISNTSDFNSIDELYVKAYGENSVNLTINISDSEMDKILGSRGYATLKVENVVDSNQYCNITVNGAVVANLEPAASVALIYDPTGRPSRWFTEKVIAPLIELPDVAADFGSNAWTFFGGIKTYIVKKNTLANLHPAVDGKEATCIVEVTEDNFSEDSKFCIHKVTIVSQDLNINNKQFIRTAPTRATINAAFFEPINHDQQPDRGGFSDLTDYILSDTYAIGLYFINGYQDSSGLPSEIPSDDRIGVFQKLGNVQGTEVVTFITPYRQYFAFKDLSGAWQRWIQTGGKVLDQDIVLSENKDIYGKGKDGSNITIAGVQDEGGSVGDAVAFASPAHETWIYAKDRDSLFAVVGGAKTKILLEGDSPSGRPILWHDLLNGGTTLNTGTYDFTDAESGDLFTYNWDNNTHSEVIPLSLVEAKTSYTVPSTSDRLKLEYTGSAFRLVVSSNIGGIGGVGYTTGYNSGSGGSGGEGFPDNGAVNNLTASYETLSVGKWYVDGWDNSSGLPDWDAQDRVAALTVFGGYDDTANGAFWMLASHRKGIYASVKSSGVTSNSWYQLDGSGGGDPVPVVVDHTTPIEVVGKDGTNHDAISVTQAGKLTIGTASNQIVETQIATNQERITVDRNKDGSQVLESLAYLSDITSLETPEIQWQTLMDAEPVSSGTYPLKTTDKVTGKEVKAGVYDWVTLSYLGSSPYSYSVQLGMVKERRLRTGENYDLYNLTIVYNSSEDLFNIVVSEATAQRKIDYSINAAGRIQLDQTVVNKGSRGKRTLYLRGSEYSITEEDIQKDIIIQAEPFIKDTDGHYSLTVNFPTIDVFKKYYYIPTLNDDQKDTLPHIMDLNIQCWLDPEEGRKDTEHRVYLRSHGDSIAWETLQSIGDPIGCFISRPANDTSRNDFVSFNFMKIETSGGSIGNMGDYTAQTYDADRVYPVGYNPPPFAPSDDASGALFENLGCIDIENVGDTLSLKDITNNTTEILVSQPIVDGFPFRPYAYEVDPDNTVSTFETINSESEVVVKDRQEIYNVVDHGYYIIQPNSINWKFDESQDDIRVTVYKGDHAVYTTTLAVEQRQTFFAFNNPAFVFKSTDEVYIEISDSFYNPLGVLGRFGQQKIEFKFIEAKARTLAYEGEGGSSGDLPLNPTFENVTLEGIKDASLDKLISFTGEDLNVINYAPNSYVTLESSAVALRTDSKTYVFDDTRVDFSGTVLTNIGDGVNPTDAVNMSQLNSKVSGGLFEIEDLSVSEEDTEIGQDFMFKNLRVKATSDTASLVMNARNLRDKSVVQLTLDIDNPYPIIRFTLIGTEKPTVTYLLASTATFAVYDGEWEMLSDARPTFSTIKPSGRTREDFIPISAILAGDNMVSSIDNFGVLRLDVVGGGSGHSFNFADDTIVKVEGEVPVATELFEKDGDLSIPRSIYLSDQELKSNGEKVTLSKKPLITQELDSFGAVKRPKILHEELSGHSYLSESGQNAAYSYPLGQEITVESDFSHLRVKPDTIAFYPDNNYSGIVFRILDQNGLEVFNLKEYRAMTEGIRHTIEHPNVFLRSNKTYSFIVTDHDGNVLSLRGAFGIQSWTFDYQEQSEKELITAEDIVQPTDPVYASITSPIIKEKTGNAQLTFNPVGQIEVVGHLDLDNHHIFNVKPAVSDSSAPNLGQVKSLIQNAEFDSGVNFDGEYVENIVTDDTISAAYNAETRTMSISAIGTPPDGGSVFPIVTPDQMTGYLVEFGNEDGTAVRTSQYTGKHLADLAIAAQEAADSANTKAIAADATAGTALAATATNSGVLTRHTVELDRMRLEIDANAAGLLSLQRGHTQTRRELQTVETKQKHHDTSIVALEAHAGTMDEKTDGMVELIESNRASITSVAETTDANITSLAETMESNFSQTEALITTLSEGNFDSVQVGVEGAQGTINITESSISANYSNQTLRTDEKLQLGVTSDGVTDNYLLLAAGSINATAKQIKNALDATEDQDLVTLKQLNSKLDIIFDKIEAIEDFIGMVQPPATNFTVFAGRITQAQVDANTISSLPEYKDITAETLLTNSGAGYDIAAADQGTYSYSVIAYPKGVLSPDPKNVIYSNLPPASRDSFEVIISNVVYIVLVPQFPDNSEEVINYTLSQ